MCRKKGTEVTVMSSIPAESLGISEVEFLNVIHW